MKKLVLKKVLLYVLILTFIFSLMLLPVSVFTNEEEISEQVPEIVLEFHSTEEQQKFEEEIDPHNLEIETLCNEMTENADHISPVTSVDTDADVRSTKAYASQNAKTNEWGCLYHVLVFNKSRTIYTSVYNYYIQPTYIWK